MAELLDTTITRLLSNKAVQGVIIMARTNGQIIRSAGSLFDEAAAPSSRMANGSEDVQQESRDDGPEATQSQQALRYAEKSWRAVEALSSELKGLEGNGEADALNPNDQVRFVRIRLKRKELLITPGMLGFTCLDFGYFT